jgi:hypothetical protein
VCVCMTGSYHFICSSDRAHMAMHMCVCVCVFVYPVCVLHRMHFNVCSRAYTLHYTILHHHHSNEIRSQLAEDMLRLKKKQEVTSQDNDENRFKLLWARVDKSDQVCVCVCVCVRV